jgi:hypothetical protein
MRSRVPHVGGEHRKVICAGVAAVDMLEAQLLADGGRQARQPDLAS